MRYGPTIPQLPTPAQAEEAWSNRPTTPPPRAQPAPSPDPRWTEPTTRQEPDEEMARRLHFEENGKAYPTEREAANLVTKGATSKQKQNLKVTGGLSDWATLSATRSHDPTMNMCYTLHGRLVTHKWKVFALMLKGRAASAIERRVWKRPVRWLGLMLGNETAKIWGHLGVASRELKQQKASQLFK